MADNIKEIIDIGEGWACALHLEAFPPIIHCYHNNQSIAEVPLSTLILCSPSLQANKVSATKKEPTLSAEAFAIDQVAEPKNLQKVAIFLNSLLQKASHPSNAMVIANDKDAPALAIALGGSSRYDHIDPEMGNILATTEAAQNMACTGASPVAFFKLPADSVQCPQPTLGLIGLLPKGIAHIGLPFRKKGDMIYLLGRAVEDIASSEYLYSYHGVHHSPAPQLPTADQGRLHLVLAEAIKRNLVNSANSITKGGLFTSLLESSLPNQLGFDITTDAEIREDAFLFGEALGRIVVSVSEENDVAFVDLINRNKISITTMGHVTKGELRVDDISFGYISEFIE